MCSDWLHSPGLQAAAECSLLSPPPQHPAERLDNWEYKVLVNLRVVRGVSWLRSSVGTVTRRDLRGPPGQTSSQTCRTPGLGLSAELIRQGNPNPQGRQERHTASASGNFGNYFNIFTINYFVVNVDFNFNCFNWPFLKLFLDPLLEIATICWNLYQLSNNEGCLVASF